jgi:hypothetical protein
MRGGLEGCGKGVGWEGRLRGRVHVHSQSWLVLSPCWGPTVGVHVMRGLRDG